MTSPAIGENGPCVSGTDAGIWEIAAGVIRVKSSVATYATDDFVVGSDQLDENVGSADDNNRMFFDKSQGAFRVGGTDNGTDWNSANIGAYSVAMGFVPYAPGNRAIALGTYVTASGEYSAAIGQNAEATGERSFSIGRSTTCNRQSFGLQ